MSDLDTRARRLLAQIPEVGEAMAALSTAFHAAPYDSDVALLDQWRTLVGGAVAKLTLAELRINVGRPSPTEIAEMLAEVIVYARGAATLIGAVPVIALAHSPDAGRRVLQCACERGVSWRGEEAARAQGWRARWVERRGVLVRTWSCGDCYVPPRAQVAQVAGQTGYLRDVVLTGDEAIAREQLDLARSDLERWSAWIGEVAALVPKMKRGRRGRWSAWLRARSRRRAA